MDICTLVIITTMNAIACIPETVCSEDRIKNRKYCEPSWVSRCNAQQEPFYECKRSDGTTYTVKQSAK